RGARAIRVQCAPMRERAPSVLDDGALAGRYRRVRQLGAGGTADVFLVEDVERLPRMKALKILHEVLAPEVRAGLREEFRLLSVLSHPGLSRENRQEPE